MTEYTCDSFRFFNLFPVYFGGKGTKAMFRLCMHLFPTCGTKINTFLRLKLHRRRFCCANHNRTRGTPCRLPIVSFSLYHASFHLSLLNLQTGMGNYPFSLFTLPQILRWPRVVFLPVFCLGFSPQHQTSTACFATCGRNRATLVLTCSW